MEYIILCIFNILSALNIYSSFRLKLTPINPISVFNIVWLLLVSSYVLFGGALELKSLSIVTWMLLFLANIGFLLGNLFIIIVYNTYSCRKKHYQYKINFIKYYYWSLVFISLSLLTAIFRMYFNLKTIGVYKAILTGYALDIRWELLKISATNKSSLSFLDIISSGLNYILFASTMALLWGGYWMVQKRYILGLFPLFISCLQSLLTLQRSLAVYSVLLFSISWYYHYLIFGSEKKILNPLKRGALKLKIFALLVFPTVLYLPAKLRYPDKTAFEIIHDIWSYFWMPIGGLNVRAIDFLSEPEHTLGWGKWTFWGIASIINRFFQTIDLPPYHLAYQFIGPETKTNAYTFLLFPLLDWGPAGVALFTFFLGCLAMYLHYNVLIKERLTYVPLLSIVTTALFMSFYGLIIFRNFKFIILILFSILINKAVLSKDTIRSAHCS